MPIVEGLLVGGPYPNIASVQRRYSYNFHLFDSMRTMGAGLASYSWVGGGG